MKAGPRDDLITIERNGGSSENTFGEVIESWSTFATAWAQVIYGKGSERRTSAVEGVDQPATFRVLANTETLAVTVADRIVFNSENWDIQNVSPLDRDAVEYTAIRRASV